MFQRKRPRSTAPDPRVAPPFMHDSDLGDDLDDLVRHFELHRQHLVRDGVPADDPRLTGLDAQIAACRGALVTVRVASIAIDRASSRGALHG